VFSDIIASNLSANLGNQLLKRGENFGKILTIESYIKMLIVSNKGEYNE
jgi:hypothetical protein